MSHEPCTIGSSITIRGNISGAEDLIVEGRVEGAVTLSNHLTVEPSGVVEADLDVESLTVKGTVQGEVTASNMVSVAGAAKMVGNIRAPRVVIEDGARFKGHIEMDVQLPEGVSQK